MQREVVYIMIKITVIAVGKLKEKYFSAAADEYIKRLSRYCKISVVEIEPARISESPTEKDIALCLADEGKRILQKIPENAYVTALCIEGEMSDSETLSKNIEKCAAKGFGNQIFIIGGSHGLSDEVKKRANEKLSMSRMTFPHKLARVILLEQIYRAFMISAGGTYHK